MENSNIYPCKFYFFYKNTGEMRTIYVWSDNENIMWSTKTDNIIEKIFGSFSDNYQKEERIIRGSDFVFESAELMDYKLHKVSLKRGGSYIKSPEWLVNKKATINLKNKKGDKCFQYTTINEIKRKEL